MKFGWCVDRHHSTCRGRIMSTLGRILVCDCPCHAKGSPREA